MGRRGLGYRELDRRGMGGNKPISIPMLVVMVCLSANISAQSTGQTVRHHRVVEQDSSFPPELTQAETAIDKRDYATAEPLLKKVVDADPNNFQAWFDLGFVYNALGNAPDSIAAYRKSVAAKPDVFESNLNLGLMLAKTGQPDAEQFLRAATTLKPTADVDKGHARAWLSLAHVLENNEPEEAINAYKQAAALDAKDPEPHLAAGLLLEKENHFADAEQEYKQALALDPNSSDALTGMANVYMRGQRYAEADPILRKIIAMHPEDVSARMQLARILLVLGKNDDAIAQLQELLKLDPGNSLAQADLGDLYLQSKKYDQAEALFRPMLATHPESAQLHHYLGVALLKQLKYADAQQELLIAVKLKPDFGEAYGDLAVAADENKNYELAIKAADARAKFLPEIPVSYFLRASAYDHLRNYKMAAQQYHRFLEVANGAYPDQEWQARHRLIAIEPKK
jgi:tetratricopeptide (TPR) repeat protein